MRASADSRRERPQHRRRRLVALAAGVLVAILALYVLLPRVAGLDETWGRIRDGDPTWIVLAAAFEVGSYACYVVLLRAVAGGREERLSWRDSWRLTLAGVAASRLLATAGAGGIALTAWALSRMGMSASHRRDADGDVLRRALRDLHGGARARRAGAACRLVRRARAVRAHGRAGTVRSGGDRRGARARARPAWAWARSRPRTACRRRPHRAARAPPRDGARDARRWCARCGRARASAGSSAARRRRVVGLRRAGPVGLAACLRRPAATGGARHELSRRATRQHVAAAGGIGGVEGGMVGALVAFGEPRDWRSRPF